MQAVLALMVTSMLGWEAMATTTRPKFSFAQCFGELLLVIGLLLGSFAYYEAFYTDVTSGRLQDEAAAQMEQEWEREYVNPREKRTPELGSAFARMYIPSFGSDFHFAIVEGVTDADLEIGPGRYTETQMPGEVGNFAVAGHRVGKGSPFNDLGQLNTCDAVVVETSSMWYVYRVLPTDAAGSIRDCVSEETANTVTSGEYARLVGRHITTPDDVGVIDRIPSSTTQAPATLPLMTMTTCHPQFSNAERMIVHSVLEYSQPKSAGRPAEL